MKNFLVLCVLVLAAVSPAFAVCQEPVAEGSSPFTLADRIGEPNERNFFLFSTSVASYALRQDGMGEVTTRAGMRRVFNVKVGVKSRINRLYFLEYQGDLLLLYETSGMGYLVRMDQKKRKMRWVAEIRKDFTPPVIKDAQAVFDDGATVSLG